MLVLQSSSKCSNTICRCIKGIVVLKPLSKCMMNISRGSTYSGGLIFNSLFIGIWNAAICTTALLA